MVKTVTIEEAMEMDCVFVDTRSPAEFAEDCIVNAVNVPLLDNEQRAIVGTLYKKDQSEAMKKGLEFVLPRAKEIHDKVNSFDKDVVVYCWRGGMRSKGVVEVANSENVYQLVDGYKDYRRYVREFLDNYEYRQKFVVISGLTCTDKTSIVNALPNSIDLEGFAKHRGSVFGALGLKCNTQKKFESLLVAKLKEFVNVPFIVVEGESNKIGDLHVPERFFENMKKGIQILIEKETEERIKVALSVYDITGFKVEFLKVLKSLERKIGKKKVEDVERLIETKDLYGACRILLEEYYDPLYRYSLDKKNFVLIVKEDYVNKIKEWLKRFDYGF